MLLVNSVSVMNEVFFSSESKSLFVQELFKLESSEYAGVYHSAFVRVRKERFTKSVVGVVQEFDKIFVSLV